jgi:hypothetical protein
MTVRRFMALRRVWDRVPPVAEMLVQIAGAFGVQRKGGSQSADTADSPSSSFETLMQALPQGTPDKVMSMAEYLERKSSGGIR